MSFHEQMHVIGRDLPCHYHHLCPAALAWISSSQRAATRPPRTGRRYSGYHTT